MSKGQAQVAGGIPASLPPSRQLDLQCRWAGQHLYPGCGCRGDLGSQWTALPVFRYLAAGHQHRDDRRHLPHGVFDSKLAKSGQRRQIKLDELIRRSGARNSFVGIEHLTDDELEDIRGKCEQRAAAEKIGDETVKKTGARARTAADKATA